MSGPPPGGWGRGRPAGRRPSRRVAVRLL